MEEMYKEKMLTCASLGYRLAKWVSIKGTWILRVCKPSIVCWFLNLLLFPTNDQLV